MHKLARAIRTLSAKEKLEFIATLGTVFGLTLGIARSIWRWEDEFSRNVFAVTLSVITLMSVLGLVYYGFTWQYKARYAEASIQLHMTLHHLRDAWVNHFDGDESQFDDLMTKCLDQYSALMSLVTGCACFSCIKQVELQPSPSEDDALNVTVLARSTGSPIADSRKHLLRENTALLELWKTPEQKAVIIGDASRHYADGFKDPHLDEDKRRGTSLRYSSLLVVPITCTVRSDAIGRTCRDIVGYLCVKSKTRQVFNKRYDAQLALGIADTLYPLIKYRNRRIARKITAAKPIEGDTSC